MEVLLNLGCRLVLRKPHFYSATASRKELGLTTLSARCKLHTCVIMFKCLHSLAPPYFSALFHTPSCHYITQSSSTRQIDLPTPRTSLGCKCSSLVGASTWRVLPKETRPPGDLRIFTRHRAWIHSPINMISLYFDPHE